MPALAAQPRAFSSLLSLPSQAQSVIKAFRRQGIGSADEFNTARFSLSRLESLSAAPTSLSFLRFRSKSSKSSEGGQMSCLLSSELSAAAIALAHISAQPRPASLCDLFRSAYAPLHKSHRLAKARIKVVAFVVLSDCCARAGKTLISRSTLSASGSCRALRACPLWHLWPISASAHADAKTVPKHHRPEMDLPLRGVCFRTVISRLQVVPGVIQMPMCESPGRTSFEVPLNYL